MMNRIKSLIAITAFSLLVLGLPAIASAQYGGQNDPYGRNGGYGNNGYYGDIRSTVRNLKQRAKNFEAQADRAARYSGRNNGGWGGYGNNNGERIEDLADRFKNAADDLEDAYGRGRNLGNSADEARRVLQIGSQIEQSMGRSGSGYNLQNDWYQISNDLRIIANTYGYSYNGGTYNRNNRNNRNNRYPQTGNRNNLPSWWPF